MVALTQWVSMVDEAVLQRVVVVSPHFDDAVLSCGKLLATRSGSTVVTVMGGQPARMPEEVTWWDGLGGFRTGDDVVGARRIEDKEALDILGATQRWLDFSDYQYDDAHERRPTAESIADVLEPMLVDLGPSAVLIPMGLANPDHVLAHEACRLVLDRHAMDWTWWAYAEAGYAHIPGLLASRIGTLFRSGLWPTPAPIIADDGLAAKQAALACYRSQLPALGDVWNYDPALHARVAESYWRLEPPPPGWEGLT